MHRYQESINDKRVELAITEERLAKWESEGFTSGVEIVKKNIKALNKIIQEIEKM